MDSTVDLLKKPWMALPSGGLCAVWIISQFFFNWSTIDIQYCVSFRCTAKWFSYPYIYFVCIFSSTVVEYSSLYYTASPFVSCMPLSDDPLNLFSFCNIKPDLNILQSFQGGISCCPSESHVKFTFRIDIDLFTSPILAPFLFSSKILYLLYLFIWFHWVLVAACGI